MLLPLLFEYLGTLIFLYVVLNVGEPIAIAAALLGAIFFGAAVSGAHFNPGITFLMWLVGKVTSTTALQYVLAQLLAAASVVFLSGLTATAPVPTATV